MKGKREITKSTVLALSLLVLAGACDHQVARKQAISDTTLDISEWQATHIKPNELVTWKLLGRGHVSKMMNGQTYLAESDSSHGLMLVSPTYYQGDVIVKYKLLSLAPASVFVTMLGVRDTAAQALTIPVDYDGNLGFWMGRAKNYLFALRNASHGRLPFLTKNPKDNMIAEAREQDGITDGVYYDVEVGREDRNLWLSLNGKRLLEAYDGDPIPGGHLALRIRGMANLKAAGLVKDMTIYLKSNEKK